MIKDSKRGDINVYYGKEPFDSTNIIKKISIEGKGIIT